MRVIAQRFAATLALAFEHCKIASLATLPAGARVLDAGAGEGSYKHHFRAHRYTGLDLAVGDAQWDYGALDVLGDLAAKGIPVDGYWADDANAVRVTESHILSASLRADRLVQVGDATVKGFLTVENLADHVMHHEQWMRAQNVVLPAARQQADLETASYGAGRAGLAEVLQAFTDLADARLTLLEREAAIARDAVRISLTYGDAP